MGALESLPISPVMMGGMIATIRCQDCETEARYQDFPVLGDLGDKDSRVIIGRFCNCGNSLDFEFVERALAELTLHEQHGTTGPVEVHITFGRSV